MLALSGAVIVCACAIWGGERLGSEPHPEAQLDAEEALACAGSCRRAHHQDQPRVGRSCSSLTSQVADLRNRQAAVAAELKQKQAELDSAQARLEALKARLHEAIQLLEQRLVAIYKSSEPDLITVLLQAHGFDDLLARTQYLQTLQHQDNDIVSRVRDLRNEMQVTVNTVRSARDEIAARKHELDVTAAKLKQRTSRARHRAPPAALDAREGPQPAGRPRGQPQRHLPEDRRAARRRHRRAAGGSDPGRRPRADLAGERARSPPASAAGTSATGTSSIPGSTSESRPGRRSAPPRPGRSRSPRRPAATGTTPASTTAAGSRPVTGTRSASWSPPVSRWLRARSSG